MIYLRLVLLLTVLLLVSSSSLAQYSVGWIYDAPDTVNGFSIGDLDNDGLKEIVLHCSRGPLVVLSHDKSVRWSLQAPPGAQLRGSPGIANLDQDPTLEVVVEWYGYGVCVYDWDSTLVWCDTTVFGTGNYGSAPAMADVNNDDTVEVLVADYLGHITCFNGQTGDIVWQYVPAPSDSDVFLGHPTVEDLDHDGAYEVLAYGSDPGLVHCVNGEDGSLKWLYNVWVNNSDYAFGTGPGVADIDGDSLEEVIIVGYSAGKIIALEHNGTFKWEYNAGDFYGDYFQFTSPSIADVDTSSPGLEVVACGETDNVYVISNSGDEQWARLYNGGEWQPSLSDLDEDGRFEIIAATWSDTLLVLDADSRTTEWTFSTDDNGFFWPYALIDDIDNDNLAELITADWATQKLYMLDLECGLNGAWPTFMHNNRRTGHPDDLPVGIEEVSSNRPLPNRLSLAAYPNPCHGPLTVEYTLPRSSAMSLHIYDVAGRKIRTLYSGQRKTGTYAARVGNLNSGVYFLKFAAAGSAATLKIVMTQ